MDEKKLAHLALKAQIRAYAPYSHFQVGAALACADGRIYTGANIENGAFSPSCCAERTAFYQAVLDGQRSFAAIAIAGGPDGSAPAFCAPCGVCRQVMREFCGEDFVILLARQDGTIRRFTLAQLLPESFTLTEAAPDHPSSF